MKSLEDKIPKKNIDDLMKIALERKLNEYENKKQRALNGSSNNLQGQAQGNVNLNIQMRQKGTSVDYL